MDLEEIRGVLASYGEIPKVVHSEKYEDSEHYIGTVGGAKVSSPNPVAEKLLQAAGVTLPVKKQP